MVKKGTGGAVERLVGKKSYNLELGQWRWEGKEQRVINKVESMRLGLAVEI